MEYSNLETLSIFKQGGQSGGIPDIPFKVGDVTVVLNCFVRQNQAADLAVLMLQRAQKRASQMAISPCDNIKFLHNRHLFQITNTLLIYFLICIIIRTADGCNHQRCV